MDLQVVKDVVQIISNCLTGLGVLVAAVTVRVGLQSFVAQRGDKRAEHFLAMRRALEAEPTFWPVRDFVNDWWDAKERGCKSEDLPKLTEDAKLHRIRFMAAFEDVAFLVNSGQMRLPVAHYMFGYDVLRAWHCDALWGEPLRNDPTWKLLMDLVEKMERCGALDRKLGNLQANYAVSQLVL